MSNFNKVLLMGRLTRDPELRYTPQGTAVSEIGLAVNREYTAGNERRKETTFVDVTFWTRQAEIICQYLKKGDPLFLEGRLSLHTWETQDGQRRSKLRVVAENFQFVGGRSEGDSRGGGGRGSSPAGAASGGEWGGGAPTAAPSRPSAAPSGQDYPPAEESGSPDQGPDDSDIPF
jgi:single-strand DNA-binding protein